MLFEERAEGRWRGYAPNYVEVFWDAPPEEQARKNLHNIVKSVNITGRCGRALKGVTL